VPALAALPPPSPLVDAPTGSAVPSRLVSPGDRAPQPVTPALVPAPAPAPAPPDLYAQARRLEAHGDYAAAAAVLQQAIAQQSDHTDLALYELGRLRQRELGDPAGALEAFQHYRAGYPKGSLSQEVDLSIIETELARAQLAPAFAELGRFLDRYPDSERAPEVHLLRGNVLRQRGECAPAIEEYRQSQRGAFADDALYFTAFCERQLGRSDAAASSLRDYLRRFPEGLHQREARAALGGP
jgi:tetratricopeptide (TPR) repeat protein